MKSGSFHMKIGGLHMKSGGFHENQLKSSKTAASTQITHFVLVFHRMQ